VFSTNKGISFMAYSQVSSARDAVSSASTAMAALVGMFPDKAQKIDISVPDGLLDLIVGLTIDPSFDFLAMSNSSKLSAAAVQCRDARARLQPLVRELEGMRVASAESVAAAMNALGDVERPFLERSAARVPYSIRIDQPQWIAE
jgi:hypothetical protein